LRTGTGISACLSNSISRCSAALRLAFCVRNLRQTTLTTPFLSALVASRLSMRFFCCPERLEHRPTSKKTVTCVLTLFMFWPPGPLLRDALKERALSSRYAFCLIRITVQGPGLAIPGRG